MDSLPTRFACHIFNILSVHDCVVAIMYGENVFPQDGNDFHV